MTSLLPTKHPMRERALAPFILDNTAFPENWFEQMSSCDKQCARCGYCRRVLEEVLVDSGGEEE